MAKRQFTPAVAYLRRSTSRQEKSLEDQRTEIERYAAAHGYRILRWYLDDGISGDATECRQGFLSLHEAACNGRDFDVILVWDQDRFGRFDSMEAGYWIHPLRKAGVRLESVTEGPINWDDFTGRVMYSIKQEGKYQFLRDLSRNTSRGQISNAQKGRLCGQAAPYGYDRMLVDESGAQCQRIRNGEKFGKPRGWRTTLVPSDDALKVSTIKWLFATYADTAIGLRGLADQLNAKGLPGPTGGPWYAASIKAMLENRNYTGTFTWAKRREGKYFSVTAGEIRERDRNEVTLSPSGKPRAVDNPEEAWIVAEDAHEALIDKATFERVQARLNERRRAKPGAAYSSHTRRNSDRYLLSGLVFCARCDCKMHGGNSVAKGHSYPKYVCSTYYRSGKNNPHGCGCHGIHQDQLVNVIVRKLQETVLTTANLTRLRQALRKQIEMRRTTNANGSDALQKQLNELNREIDRAAKNFLRAPEEVLDVVAEQLTAMKRQRDHLQKELRVGKTKQRPQDIDAEVEAVVGRLGRLREDLAKGDPARRREVFRLLVRRIDLRFDKVQRGKRTECPFRSGEIHLRTGEGSIFGSVNRGDWQSFERVLAEGLLAHRPAVRQTAHLVRQLGTRKEDAMAF
jgi:DNA invertase Pin-like site-specific DNA recombinase